ncbi:MAG TPA: P1 family peptidase [Roseiflexaceae bacterium]|nr:P1 family peptidase [Roseiflexaceae bacterium]
MNRARIRDLGITIGELPTGPYNAITDVPGVLVGQATVIADEPRVARTGVTMIVPRDGDTWSDRVFGGFFSFNGNGEMTGLPWLEESGMIDAAIGISNTHAVGVVRDAIVAHAVEHGQMDSFILPIAAETYDGWLSDIDAFHITQEHALAALAAAKGGPVDEGDVGGGTGMICHGFKGGIGTSSRVVAAAGDTCTVGALVQANYGARRELRIDGVPVGREIGPDRVPARQEPPGVAGSIIVVVATDAPLLPIQCKRLARRATAGLARVGGVGYNGSGDIFLAFATGNHLPKTATPLELKMLPHEQIDDLFVATADAVEESILNALAAADTMTGFKGRTIHALPLDEVQAVMARYRPA